MGVESATRAVGQCVVDGVARVLTGLSTVTPNASNAIIEYHSVGEPERYDNVSVGQLRRDLSHVKRRYEIVDLPEILTTSTDPEKKVALTFDDGFVNFYENAYPVVREFDVPVTLFVNAGFVDGGDRELLQRYRVNPSNLAQIDRSRPSFESEDILTEAQLKELAADDRITVGNHTKRHANLATIDDEETLREEIVGGKESLEAMLDVTVDRFCYPYGQRSTESAAVVRDTHALAVTSRPALVQPTADRYALPRVSARTNETRFRCNLTDLCWRAKRLQSSLPNV